MSEQFPKEIEQRIILWKESWLRDGDQDRRLKLANQIIGVLPRILRHVRHLEQQAQHKRCPDCGYLPGERPVIESKGEIGGRG